MRESVEILSPKNAAIAGNESSPRLLVVDDQPLNVENLYEIFRNDHEVFVATSGKQALKMCRSNPPDLILLDMVMPEMGGMELCRLLKLDPETRDIPIIFVTAKSKAEDETMGLEAGAVDFITKPVNPAVVRARVHTHLTLKNQTDLLRSMAFTDGLTGIANRRRFDENLKVEWHRCRRNRIPLAIFMADIDHFKKYNDQYGHQVGDACLQKIGETLNSQLRLYDLVARYGGEEFVCLLSGSNLSSAMGKAQKMIQTIFELGLPHAESETAPVVTISLGVAVAIPDEHLQPDELLAAADAQLYKAKKNGRNRVYGVEITQKTCEVNV